MVLNDGRVSSPRTNSGAGEHADPNLSVKTLNPNFTMKIWRTEIWQRSPVTVWTLSQVNKLEFDSRVNWKI
jgi:hypothetical protein